MTASQQAEVSLLRQVSHSASQQETEILEAGTDSLSMGIYAHAVIYITSPGIERLNRPIEIHKKSM